VAGVRQDRWWLRAPVLVAPDKFKGTLTAAAVAAAIAAGLREGGRNAEELPVADGGEGTAEALLRALGGEWVEAEATDALGRPIRARFAMLDGRVPESGRSGGRKRSVAERTAVVEAAEASGLARIEAGERDAFAASSRGTGELIAAACAAGAAHVLVAVGGTATTDGGAGALAALDEAAVDPELTVVCDVRTPFEKAARIFAPQKGADAATVKRLERRLNAFASKAARDPRGVPLTGAGGGLAGGLYAQRRAQLVPGAAFVLDALGFDARMRAATFVVTGEGRLDEQTLEGKVAGEVAVRCRQAGVACHAVVGEDAIDDFSLRVLALDGLAEAGDPSALRAAGLALA
jgi:glycerate 2-kinase